MSGKNLCGIQQQFVRNLNWVYHALPIFKIPTCFNEHVADQKKRDYKHLSLTDKGAISRAEINLDNTIELKRASHSLSHG